MPLETDRGLKNTPDVFIKEHDTIQDFIIHLGLWNINRSQFLAKGDDTLVCVDLEDPDNSNPANFFNADYEKVKSNIRCGLAELQRMMGSNEKDSRPGF